MKNICTLYILRDAVCKSKLRARCSSIAIELTVPHDDAIELTFVILGHGVKKADSVLYVDQLAKPTFRSRYAHTPFGSAPVPTPSS